MMDKMTVFQLVGFCVLMQNNDGIAGKSPKYIMEKARAMLQCSTPAHVRGPLDLHNQRIFDKWCEEWKFSLTDVEKEMLA